MLPESEWGPMLVPDKTYPDWVRCSYESLIESTGCQIVESESVGDYQGDSCALLYDGGRWGFIAWGWGSCSGCDALQACDNDEQHLADLRRQLHSDIHWEDDKFRLTDWLLGRDWECQWYGSQATFILKATAHMDPQHRFSPTTVALIANPECLPEIAADSADDDGYEWVAKGLRNQHAKWSVKASVLKEMQRVGLLSGEAVNADSANVSGLD